MKKISTLRCALPLCAALTLLLPGIAAHAQAQNTHARNLILNGDFSGGNNGFDSDYAFNDNASNHVTGYGTYGIISNPAVDYMANGNYGNFGDHTGGHGKMMFVDGSTSGADAAIWAETVNVGTNTTYTFTFWSTEAFDVSPPTFRVFADDTQIGSDFSIASPVGKWQKFTGKIFSGSKPNVTLKIVDTNTDGNGNDFCIDDISLIAVSAAPQIVSISPSQFAPSASPVQIVVTGSSFAPDDVVTWDGVRLATTYGNPSQLTASVTPALLQTLHQARVQVIVPATSKASNWTSATIAPAGQ